MFIKYFSFSGTVIAHKFCTLASDEGGMKCLHLTWIDHLIRVLTQDSCCPKEKMFSFNREIKILDGLYCILKCPRVTYV